MRHRGAGDGRSSPRRARGELADEVWSVLREAGRPLTPGEVRQRLTEDRSYSTVVTTVTRLHGKGLLTRSADGRAYRYAPVSDAAGLTARTMRLALDEQEDPAARGEVLARFVSELDAEDEAALRRLLAAADETDPDPDPDPT